MGADGSPRSREAPGHLEISLHSAQQLFNSLDPSPFYEKDLDAEADHYLVSWAQSLPRHEPLKLTLHLREHAAEDLPPKMIAQAVHSHFDERARLTQVELDQLFDHGRVSLLIGIAVLCGFLFLSQLFADMPGNVATGLLRESFAIAGWVAMWHPMQIYLYDWWPLRARVKLFRRMAHMPVTVRAAR
jgi:hypothetical protein